MECKIKNNMELLFSLPDCDYCDDPFFMDAFNLFEKQRCIDADSHRMDSPKSNVGQLSDGILQISFFEGNFKQLFYYL